MTEKMLRALGPLGRCGTEPCETCDEIDRAYAALIGNNREVAPPSQEVSPKAGVEPDDCATHINKGSQEPT